MAGWQEFCAMGFGSGGGVRFLGILFGGSGGGGGFSGGFLDFILFYFANVLYYFFPRRWRDDNGFPLSLFFWPPIDYFFETFCGWELLLRRVDGTCRGSLVLSRGGWLG